MQNRIVCALTLLASAVALPAAATEGALGRTITGTTVQSFAGVVPPTPVGVATTLVLGTGVHPLLTVIGYLLRMRPTAR